MDNILNIGLSRQMTLQHELDVVANNVANVDTAGFKVESLTVQTDRERLPSGGQAPDIVNFAWDAGVARNFSQGALKQTGSPFDIALEGDGFFKISTPDGERYTRDGRFSIDSQGRLSTQSGQPVQGDGGDIVIDPAKGPPTVASDGTISQDGQTLGKLSVVNFSSLSALSKAGDGLYRNNSNLTSDPVTDVRIMQGMVESSNVDPIAQITRLIEVSRAYEQISKMMDDTGNLSDKSVDSLGHIS